MRTLPMTLRIKAIIKITWNWHCKWKRKCNLFLARENKIKKREKERAIYGIAIIDESCAHFHVGETSCWKQKNYLNKMESTCICICIWRVYVFAPNHLPMACCVEEYSKKCVTEKFFWWEIVLPIVQFLHENLCVY